MKVARTVHEVLNEHVNAGGRVNAVRKVIVVGLAPNDRMRD
jgi:hypothetical protein